MSPRVMCYLWHGTKTVFEKLRKTGGGYDTMLQSKTRPVSYTPASTPPRTHRFAYKLLFFYFLLQLQRLKINSKHGKWFKNFLLKSILFYQEKKKNMTKKRRRQSRKDFCKWYVPSGRRPGFTNTLAPPG